MAFVRYMKGLVASFWLFPFACIGGAATSQAIDPPKVISFIPDSIDGAKDVNRGFTRLVQADGATMDAYLEIEAATEGPERPWSVKQLRATADALVGRYADARAIRDAHRKMIPACPVEGDVWPAVLRKLDPGIQILMINEDHLDPTTRAMVIRALPVLYEMGFTHLAMESIPDDSVLRSVRQGRVLDNAAAGVYLREPIEAFLVRRAQSLGFTIESYDTDAASRDRESAQATKLESQEAVPNTKTVVFAGHSHVSKSGAWLAQKLSRRWPGRVFSIDQTTLAGVACRGTGDSRLIRWSSPKALTDGGIVADAILVSTGNGVSVDERNDVSSWLSLDGTRHPVKVGVQSFCPKTKKACLIQARRDSESSDVVPMDRYLATSKTWEGFLFLASGRYVIEGTDEAGRKTVRRLTVK